MADRIEEGKTTKREKELQEARLTPWERALAARIDQTKTRQMPNDPAAREAYPNLWEMLTCCNIGEKYVTVGATVSVSLGIGGWSVKVSHPDTGLALAVASPTLGEAFASIEREIANPKANWTYFKGKEPRLRKKPKDNP